MPAKHRQKQLGNGPRAAGESGGYDDFEPRPVTIEPEVDGADVSLRAEAIGQQAPVREFREHPLHDRMVDAERGKAVEGDVADKGFEGLAKRLEISVKVEVLGVDVGDDGNCRRQPREGAVALVGLDHHPLAGAETSIRAVGVDYPAVDHRRIELRLLKQRADH